MNLWEIKILESNNMRIMKLDKEIKEKRPDFATR